MRQGARLGRFAGRCISESCHTCHNLDLKSAALWLVDSKVVLETGPSFPPVLARYSISHMKAEPYVLACFLFCSFRIGPFDRRTSGRWAGSAAKCNRFCASGCGACSGCGAGRSIKGLALFGCSPRARVSGVRAADKRLPEILKQISDTAALAGFRSKGYLHAS